MTGKGKHKNLLKPKPNPTLHNAFAIHSQPDDPTNYNMLSKPPLKMDDDKTILPPDPREHRRQRKIARRQHIKRTLQRLRDSDNLFLDNSITCERLYSTFPLHNGIEKCTLLNPTEK